MAASSSCDRVIVLAAATDHHLWAIWACCKHCQIAAPILPRLQIQLATDSRHLMHAHHGCMLQLLSPLTIQHPLHSFYASDLAWLGDCGPAQSICTTHQSCITGDAQHDSSMTHRQVLCSVTLSAWRRCAATPPARATRTTSFPGGTASHCGTLPQLLA